MMAFAGSMLAETIATRTYSYSFPGTETKVSVQYPTDGSTACSKAIRRWINEELGGQYNGSLGAPDEMMAFYKNRDAEEFAHPEYNETFTLAITKEYETAKVVTFMVESYVYEGGAHGMYLKCGITFRKTDGRQFGMDCIKSWNALSTLTRAGLRKYFKVKTNAQLNQQLQVENPNRIPAPTCKPWITAQGVTFYYTPYEIACYAAGDPHFTLTKTQITPHLTALGKSFF